MKQLPTYPMIHSFIHFQQLKWFVLLAIFFSYAGITAQEESLQLQGIQEEVEIRIDKWGIAHIYAKNEADLFFAQGYHAARDRLFQFEIWRRQATGTVAEILGPRELKRDIGTRLFMFRGNIQQEMNHYHPRGERIITSYVRGVNAYIEETEKHPELLPLEFGLLGITPQKWTAEVVISRHQGLLGNIGRELSIARLLHKVGRDKTLELSNFHPNTPRLELDPAIDSERLFDDILGLYNAFRRPIRFQPEDLIAEAQNDWDSYRYLAGQIENEYHQAMEVEIENIGSNNWVVDGSHTESGYPIMANDPHRSLAVPSLRYWVHLVAPGWNVIGGGEPEIPGISIGHNGQGSWGLTVFRTDAEDLYVYNINPKNPNEYEYQGRWEGMRIIKDKIPIKGQKAKVVEYKYTRHGPVVYEDSKNKLAYAIRAGWMEVGGSPYLASLRMNQAQTWEEFREACNYSHIPGENMIWADKDGNIGWQAVGIAPIRPNWDGLLPVPGDGRYEWAGYLPIISKPMDYNPPKGYIATANEVRVPPEYKHKNAVGFEWSDPFRANRLHEVLSGGRRHSMGDMIRLQTDYLSIPARNLVPLLKELSSENREIEAVRQRLLSWDFRLEKTSIEAGIYVAWERQIQTKMNALLIPDEAKEYVPYLSMKRTLDWLISPHPALGKNPIDARDQLLMDALEDALKGLEKQLGPDKSKWQYGQLAYKHVLIRHPLSSAVSDKIREKLEVGPLARGGNSFSVGNTASGNNQTHGATFRLIVDTANWDNSVGMNSPGQSGDPDSPHYSDLFSPWAKDQYFPVVYSRARVEAATESIYWLKPEGK